MTRETWIRVKSEKELRAGMCVELRPCRERGHDVQVILFGRGRQKVECVSCGRCRGWETSDGALLCPVLAVPEGRLFRLSDAALDSTDETTTAPREREEVTR